MLQIILLIFVSVSPNNFFWLYLLYFCFVKLLIFFHYCYCYCYYLHLEVCLYSYWLYLYYYEDLFFWFVISSGFKLFQFWFHNIVIRRQPWRWSCSRSCACFTIYIIWFTCIYTSLGLFEPQIEFVRFIIPYTIEVYVGWWLQRWRTTTLGVYPVVEF